MPSRGGKVFHFSSYWCTWSRVLTEEDPCGPYVEVDLTVPSSLTGKDWDTVRCINIRRHGTRRGKRDIVCAELPDEALRQMHKALGAELTWRLLTEDFLSEIDWAKYETIVNGGAAFESIRK